MAHILSRLSQSMPQLDKQAAILKQATEPLFGPDAPAAIKDALYGTWLGHPVHPAMTDIPIGSWTATAVLDVLGYERASDATLKIGVLGAVGAAVTGFAQWFDLQEMEEPRRLGALHASLNSAALALYVTSWVLRDRGQREAGVATAMAGYAVSSTSAWIGGHLSFKLGIGVSRVAFEEGSDEWVDAGTFAQVPDGQLTLLDVKGAPVMFLRQGSEILAASSTCTHVGGPLNEGEFDSSCVTCPWHGSVFDLRDGNVVHGPATAPLNVYETRVEGESIHVRMAAT